MKGMFLIALAATVVAIPIFCQAPSAEKPKFEVASVKPSEPGQRGSMIGMQPGGRLVVQHLPLRALVTFAYNVRDFQLTGGPSWMTTDFWDIEARVDEASISEVSGPPDPSKPNPMAVRLQSLLQERFQLKTHTETRELPVYELSIAKSGLKMKLSDDQTPYKPRERGEPPPPPLQRGGAMPRYSMRMGRGNMEAVAMDEANIVRSLSGTVGRIIIDKTGLKGLYDLKLQWTPDPPAGGNAPGGAAGPGGPEFGPPVDPNGPSIFTALQEQLGLKLDSAKGPVEVIVVDSVQKPSEN
jgi:uncharacterized protein (TIGR03435 family)